MDFIKNINVGKIVEGRLSGVMTGQQVMAEFMKVMNKIF